MQNKIVLYLISGFFRLGPLGLGMIAAMIMGAGYYLQVLENQRMARDAQALAAGMPEVVDVRDARGAAALSAVDEVNAQTQLAWDYSYDLWYEENLGADFTVMFPILAPDASSMNDVIGVAMFQAEDESFETLGPEMVKAWFVGEADYGPVMNLNGELDGMGKWQGLVEDSFYDLGLTMPADPIVIWPYIDGRDVALAPREAGAWTIFGVLSKVAGAIGLFALGKLVIGRKPEDEIPEPAMMGGVAMNTPHAQGSGVPLWKQRSGLVDEDAFVEAAPEPWIIRSFKRLRLCWMRPRRAVLACARY